MNAWYKFWCESHWIERAAMIGGAAGIIFFGGYLYRAQTPSTSLPPLFKDAPTLKNSPDAPTATTKTQVTIHIVGAIAKPGVLVLPSNARVQDAIHAAGGATKSGKPDALNLAARLADGEQIRVPSKTEAAVSSTSALALATREKLSGALSFAPSLTRSTRTPALPLHSININSASATELDALPGIGPALAARIIAYRAQHGHFRSLNDLDEVNGIGSKKLDKLRPYVAF